MNTEVIDSMRNISMFFISLFIQGLPFLVLGSLLGAVISTRISLSRWLLKIPRQSFLGALTGALAGFILPSCECFVIPLVRRLKAQGLPTSAAVAYLLAAPTLNPLSLISTWSAFSTTPYSYAIFIRVIGSLILSVGIGMLFSKMPEHHLWKGDLLREMNPRAFPSPRYSWGDTISMALEDLRSIAIYYIIGCFMAALLQNTSILPVLSVSMPMADTALMMVLAYISSVCSSADAFIASSITSVSFAAKMAFLWLGPILDLKLTFTYPLLLKARPFLILIFTVIVLIFAMSWILGKALYSI